MSHFPTPTGDDRFLAEMLRPGDPAPHPWSEQDLADMLRHQLATPLALDLSRVGPTVPPAAPGEPRTFGELLSHPRPPLQWLRRVKDFARLADRLPDGALPAEVATALYYAAIAAALARHGVRLTELPPKELARGLAWVVARPWADEATRRLCQEAAAKAAEAGGPAAGGVS